MCQMLLTEVFIILTFTLFYIYIPQIEEDCYKLL